MGQSSAGLLWTYRVIVVALPSIVPSPAWSDVGIGLYASWVSSKRRGAAIEPAHDQPVRQAGNHSMTAICAKDLRPRSAISPKTRLLSARSSSVVVACGIRASESVRWR